MLHILFLLLKILFFLLLSVLLIGLLAVLLFLFVPVRYRAHLQKEGDDPAKQEGLHGQFHAQVNVHWLLHLVHAQVNVQGMNAKVRVTLFGYLVVGREKPKKKEMPREKRRPQPEDEWAEESLFEMDKLEKSEIRMTESPKEETYPAEQTEEICPANDPILIEDGGDSQIPEQSETKLQPFAEDESSKQTIWSGIRKFIETAFAAVKKFCFGIWNSFKRIPDKLRNIRKSYQKAKTSFAYYRRIWYDEHTKKAKKHCIKEIRYLLRHYLPKMQKGHLLFGLDDPAMTGQVLGGLYVLQGLTGGQMQIEADFEQFRLEGDVILKGHIRLCHLIKTAFSLFLDKDIQVTVKRIRKMQGKPEN